MGRWAQARKKGGGPQAYSLVPPTAEDWEALRIGPGLSGAGTATCLAAGLLYRWRAQNSVSWSTGVDGACDDSQELESVLVIGQVWEVQAAWFDGFSQVSDWSQSQFVTIT